MNAEFIMAYIPRKMQEMGVGNQYLLKARHLILKPNEKRIIEAYNQYYFLVFADTGIAIKSDLGEYSISDESITELQYEHQGKIEITNSDSIRREVQFVQVIIKNQ